MNVVLTDDEQRRFLAKFRVGDGYWEWQGRPWAGGYGRFERAQGSHRAHRISYELFVGPIPDGLQLDHLYVEGNIKWQRKGRECRICNHAAQRARRQRIKQRAG